MKSFDSQLNYKDWIYLMKHQALYIAVIFLLGVTGCSEHQNDQMSSKSIGHISLEPLPVTDVQFFSNSLQRDMHINVILPGGYERSDLHYPVLYLCHGLTSNYHEFKYVGVPEYLNKFDMIVVMVDVGNSWYVNWVVSEEGQKNNFADHVCIDVINYVDQHYRTIADRKGRAINGISMGGFGAISLGLTHPELFCSIGSHSGVLNYAAEQRKLLEKGEKSWVIWPQVMEDTVMRYRDIDLKGYTTMKERTPRGQLFVKPEDADKVDPFKLVLQIPKEQIPHIYLDCGVGDFLIQPTQEFMNLLMEHKIPFVYGQSDGVHEEDYWGREIPVSMAVQYAVMLRNIWGQKFEVYDAFPKGK